MSDHSVVVRESGIEGIEGENEIGGEWIKRIQTTWRDGEKGWRIEGGRGDGETVLVTLEDPY